MYTHWQAAWRSAGALGIALLTYTCVLLPVASQAGGGFPALMILMTILGASILTSVLAVAFRCGLYLSGIKGVGLSVVVATSAIYLLLVLLFTAVPIQTHAVVVDIPSLPGQSRHSLLMLNMAPVGVIAITLFVLPLAVAFTVARVAKGRAGPPDMSL